MAQFYSAKWRVTTRQIVTVTVNDLDPFGQGVARHDGKALFISELSPQESAKVVITEDKKQFARARVKRCLNDSPQREVSRCPHFDVCDDYQQQHVSISLQQCSKSTALSCLMKCEVSDVIADAPWGYRRRACLNLNYRPKEQKLQMGFRKSGSSDIIDVKQCPILVPQLETLLPHLRACLESLQGLRHLGHVELVQTGSRTLMVLRHTAPLNAVDRKKLECFLHSQGLSLSLTPQSEILGSISEESPWHDSNGLWLVFSPRGFIQVSKGVNQQMVACALEWLDVQPEDRVLDLFCGMGSFTLLLAARAANVVDVEGISALVEKGRENALNNGLHNVTFFHENPEEDVTRQPWVKNGFDKVLLDSARAGAAGVMRHIIKLGPIRAVYVSYNPAALARDSGALLNAGYAIRRLAILDMFPHTGHLESMVLFERL